MRSFFFIFPALLFLHLVFFAFTGIALWGPSPGFAQFSAIVFIHIVGFAMAGFSAKGSPE